ncbi:MAG: single-stranded-DNA-specific exonuclease RecJ [Thermotogae bacterium]|nr:single-stranded-DNA-specific exonuclease RecJ [Thermotogota bacterium]
MITVDCGITSINEVIYAKSIGMRVIVTDHHEPQETLPPADAVVNPKRWDDEYPFKGLAGCGVSFKVLTAVASRIDKNYSTYKFIDLVSIGTIADIVPLLSENRYFVKTGLEKIKNNPMKGVEALLKELKIVPQEVKSHVIAYKVAPKINAAGRMADAFTAFKLLTSENDEEIHSNVSSVIKLNSKRQSKEKEIYLFALSMLDVNPNLKEDNVIVLAGDNWHLGVLGIVASKLSSQFNKPVLMISKEDDFGKGSARSPQGINLMELFRIASSKKNAFREFGGHELAAGFTIDSENIDELRISVNEAYKELYGDVVPVSEMSIDMEIDSIWGSFFEDIMALEPFGYKNPEPVFLMKKVKIENIKFFGNAVESFAGKMKNRKDMIMDIIGYGMAPKFQDLRYNNPVSLDIDIIGNFREENSFNLRHKFLKFYLKDLKIIDNKYADINNDSLEPNPVVNDEINKINKIEVIKNNFQTPKTGMFLPGRIKYATILAKITDSISKNRKVIIVGSSHILLKHTYDIISSYLSPTIMYYVKKTRVSVKSIQNEKVIFITVPALIHNLKIFNYEKFDYIIDEPYYSIAHPAIKSVKEYSEFRKFIALKNSSVMAIGNILHDTVKEFLKRSGYKILISNANQMNFEVVRENKKLSEILSEYFKLYQKRVIVINDRKKQEILAKMLVKKFNIPEDSIKIYNNDFDFSKKLYTRENTKKSNHSVFITSYSNNGIIFDSKIDPNVFILLDPPKNRLEMIDLFSTWNPKKNVLNIVLAYDSKFKARMLYELSKNYPSSNLLKQTYDFIKNGNDIKEKDITDELFKGDFELSRIALDCLLEAGIIHFNSNFLEIIDDFDLKSIHNGVKVKESILDTWLIKENIDFFTDIEIKKFMDLLKNNLTEMNIRIRK